MKKTYQIIIQKYNQESDNAEVVKSFIFKGKINEAIKKAESESNYIDQSVLCIDIFKYNDVYCDTLAAYKQFAADFRIFK